MRIKLPLPNTSPQVYLSGFTALNIPSSNGKNGDWHFTSAFSKKAEFSIAGDVSTAFVNTNWLMGNKGIIECSKILRDYGIDIDKGTKVFAANYVRAVIDLLVAHALAGAASDHVISSDLFDNYEDWQNVLTEVRKAALASKKSVIKNHLNQWVKKQRYEHD